MNHLLVEMLFGSHLYGTATPDSDRDFKGVYRPSHRELMLNRFPKTINLSTKTDSSVKNTSADTDRELYSLHYFFDLARKGETVALDMLHAPMNMCTRTTEEWRHIVTHRALFYTKNLSSLVGYARKQASKYGVKGSRLAEAKVVLELMHYCSGLNPNCRVSDMLDTLPVGEHCGPMTADGVTFYQVCGRKMTLNASVAHYISMVENFIKEYGDRAKQAEENKGVDWKAVSHAFRAAYQVRGILKDGGFTYPLPETDFLRAVKGGTLHFKNEVAPKLDDLMDEVEALSKASTLPEKVDDEKIDKLLLDVLDTF